MRKNAYELLRWKWLAWLKKFEDVRLTFSTMRHGAEYYCFTEPVLILKSLYHFGKSSLYVFFVLYIQYWSLSFLYFSRFWNIHHSMKLAAFCETGFHYQDKTRPIDYVVKIASNMQVFLLKAFCWFGLHFAIYQWPVYIVFYHELWQNALMKWLCQN